jgi:hypothetical protein
VGHAESHHGRRFRGEAGGGAIGGGLLPKEYARFGATVGEVFADYRLLKADHGDETGAHFETKQRQNDGTILDVELSNNRTHYGGQKLIFCVCRDVTDRNRTEREKQNLIEELQAALSEIKTPRGILPICSSCNRIMDEKGEWQRFEAYIKRHSEAKISYGLCPDCARQAGGEYGAPDG